MIISKGLELVTRTTRDFFMSLIDLNAYPSFLRIVQKVHIRRRIRFN